MMILPHGTDTLPLPHNVFPCPICGAKTRLEVESLEDDEHGRWMLSDDMGFHVTCTTVPDIDLSAYSMRTGGHYAMPYGGLVTLGMRVQAWVNAQYRWAAKQ